MFGKLDVKNAFLCRILKELRLSERIDVGNFTGFNSNRFDLFSGSELNLNGELGEIFDRQNVGVNHRARLGGFLRNFHGGARFFKRRIDKHDPFQIFVAAMVFPGFFPFLVESDGSSVPLNSGIGCLGNFGLAHHSVGMVQKRYGMVSVVSAHAGFEHGFSLGSKAGGLTVSG